jgi:hypothetical protein
VLLKIILSRKKVGIQKVRKCELDEMPQGGAENEITNCAVLMLV